MPTVEDFSRILSAYGVSAPLIKMQPLQRSANSPNLLRLIYRLDTADGHQWVCRLTHAPSHQLAIAEQQALFAMLLYTHGIPTPSKLRCKGSYCSDQLMDEKKFCVTLESYMGIDLEIADLYTFDMLGEMIGRIHMVSQEHPIYIGFSTTFQEISTGQARYANILRQAQPKLPQTPAIMEATHLHDGLVDMLRPVWNTLPRGAVHGDLGIYNNFVVSNTGLTVIDFDLAGDEVYLGDLLAAYYSSIHKYTWQARLVGIDHTMAKERFLEKYSAWRKLATLEQQYFPVVSALFDGLFYSKAAVERWNKHPTPDALAYFEKAPALFSAGFSCME